jgi:hypothetical protein
VLGADTLMQGVPLTTSLSFLIRSEVKFILHSCYFNNFDITYNKAEKLITVADYPLEF